jgi:hypothetical protein
VELDAARAQAAAARPMQSSAVQPARVAQPLPPEAASPGEAELPREALRRSPERQVSRSRVEPPLRRALEAQAPSVRPLLESQPEVAQVLLPEAQSRVEPPREALRAAPGARPLLSVA